MIEKFIKQFKTLTLSLPIITNCLLAYNTFANTCGGVETSILSCNEGGSGSIDHLLISIINIFTIGIGILGIIGILTFGVQYLTTSNNEEKVRKAKQRFFQIIIGIVCYVLLWEASQWLLPGGLLATTQDMTGVKEISISYKGNPRKGDTISPKVTFNKEAQNTTYSLTSSNKKIAKPLGSHILCVSTGKTTIQAIATNGVKSSMELTCKEPEKKVSNTSHNSTNNNSNAVCDTSNIDKKKGLTYRQARILAMKYGANAHNDSKKHTGRMWNGCGGGGSNCTAVSAFFYNKFTNSKVEGWSDGATGAIVSSKASGKPMIDRSQGYPPVWSIVARRDLQKYGGFGHTAVVVGHQDDGQWIIVEGSCQRGNRGLRGRGNGLEEGGGSAFVKRNSNPWTAAWIFDDVVWARYVDISDMIDFCLLADYVRSEK